MNLVDAIRRASATAQEPHATVSAHLSPNDVCDDTIDAAVGKVGPDQSVEHVQAVEASGTKHTGHPQADETTFPPGVGLNLVRFEVFLTPEQMSAMLRGALSSHRSVMTVREAASYLRISSGSVERLAAEGNLPGFMIEGTWRFLKTTIDDWVGARTAYPEEGLHDVA